MGTIVIEQYANVGSDADRGAPLFDLNSCLATTVDATTSTTAESVALNASTRAISVYAVEDHRVTVLSSDGSEKYAFIPAGQIKDFGVNPGSTLYYKANA